MFILFLFICVIGFILIKRHLTSAEILYKGSPKCLKQHRWVDRGAVDDGKHYLICKDCGQHPGDIQ